MRVPHRDHLIAVRGGWLAGCGVASRTAATDYMHNMAASTAVTLRTILSMILYDAIDERLIPTNPVRATRPPPRSRPDIG